MVHLHEFSSQKLNNHMPKIEETIEIWVLEKYNSSSSRLLIFRIDLINTLSHSTSKCLISEIILVSFTRDLLTDLQALINIHSM